MINGNPTAEDHLDARHAMRTQLLELLSATCESRTCMGWHQPTINEMRDEGGVFAVLEEACEGWPAKLYPAMSEEPFGVFIFKWEEKPRRRWWNR